MAAVTETSTTTGVSSDDSIEGVDQWLKSESTKLVLASLDDRRKAGRSASVLLWSSAAYVCIAAVSHLQTQAATDSRLAAAKKQMDDQSQQLSIAKTNEDRTFGEHLKAVNRSEMLAGQVLLAGKDIEISDRRAVDNQVDKAGAEREYGKAVAERDSIQAKILRDEVRPQVLRPLWEAEQKATRAKENLDRARSGGGGSTAAQKAASQPPVAPLDAHLKHRDLLQALADARQQLVRTENEWKQAQRSLGVVRTSYESTKSDDEKLRREPSPLTLPILSLAVRPQDFFWVAPLLVLLLYWNVALACWRLRRSLGLAIQAATSQRFDWRTLDRFIPELERTNWGRLGRVGELLPELATVASLTVIAFSGPGIGVAMALVAALVTAGFRATALCRGPMGMLAPAEKTPGSPDIPGARSRALAGVSSQSES